MASESAAKITDFGHETRLRLLKENPQDPKLYLNRPGFINVRRCQATARSTGEQCNRNALKNSKNCFLHQRGRKKRTKRTKSVNKRGGFANLMYTEGKSLQLKQALKNASKDSSEVLRLDEEIAVLRMLTDKALNLFDATIISPPEGKQPSPELRVAVMQNLRTMIKEVAVVSEKAANIYAKSDFCMNAYQVDTILNAVFAVIIKHLAEFDRTTCTNILDEITKLAVDFKKKGDELNTVSEKSTSDVQVSFESTPLIDVQIERP